MNTKTTVESVIGTLTTISFAIPGEGPVIAGGFAAFELIFKLFYPDPPPPSPPVDRAELKKELKDLLDKMVDASWKTTSDQDRDDLLSISDKLIDDWHGMNELGIDTKTSALARFDPHSKNWTHSLDPHTTNLITQYQQTYVGTIPVLYQIKKYQNHFINSSLTDPDATPLTVAEHYTAQTALLCLANGLMVTYLKMVTIWEWGWAMLQNAQYDAYKAAVDEWHAHVKKNPSWATTYPYIQLVADLDAQYSYLKYPGYQRQTWNLYANDPANLPDSMNKYVNLMLEHCVTKADGTDGLYTKMRKDWNALETMVSGYDVLTMYPHGMVQSNELADAVSKGRKRAMEWKTMLNTNALIDVTEDDIDLFGKCIDLWRGAQASLNFYTYPVKAGDTMQGIAASEYSDSSLWFSICNHNWDRLTDLNPLPIGIQLKIYRKEHLPYVALDVTDSGVPVVTHAVAAGETLSSIATSQYGDATLWPTIFYLNRTQLKDPAAALTAGTLLTLYKKGTLPYVTASLYLYSVPAGINLYTLAGTQYGDPNLWQDIVDLNRDQLYAGIDPEDTLAFQNGQLQLRFYKRENLPYLTPWAVKP
jgi:LysM repeat protein